MKIFTRGAAKRLGGFFALVAIGIAVFAWIYLRMPGEPHEGPTPARPDLIAELRRDLDHLCRIGERNVSTPEGLARAADWIDAELRRAGYAPTRQVFEVDGVTCANIEAAVGSGEEIVVVGAHYDTVYRCPGANDNGSGVVATLALARRFAKRKPTRTLRFVFFANEEPPYFQTEHMGSLHYAKRCRERDENVVAMISLETMGYYSDAPGSQEYPIPGLGLAYGDKGNYVAIVGDTSSHKLVKRVTGVFREHARVPSRGVALLAAVPGVGWSDHWSFWQCGYKAIMFTDTAPFRYPHYHKANDTPEQLRYEPFAEVVRALIPVIDELTK